MIKNNYPYVWKCYKLSLIHYKEYFTFILNPKIKSHFLNLLNLCMISKSFLLLLLKLNYIKHFPNAMIKVLIK